MVRPNGSVIGPDRAAEEGDTITVIECLLAQSRECIMAFGTGRHPNLGTLSIPHNLSCFGPFAAYSFGAACHQRSGGGACPGLGKTDSAGAAASRGFLGFGCMGLCGFGGGAGARNSATTGLGSSRVVPAENRPPSVRDTCTGSATGSRPGIA